MKITHFHDHSIIIRHCIPCIHEDYTKCENKEYVEPFSSVTFGTDTEESDDEDNLSPSEEETYSNNDSLTNLIWKDSVVALKPSSDSNREYFLFHVTSDGVIELTETVHAPEYGHTHFPGAKVIKGYYYSYTKTTRDGCFYKKLLKEAIVPKESVLYVGVDLQSQGKSPELYLLKSVDECDIMCAISM